MIFEMACKHHHQCGFSKVVEDGWDSLHIYDDGGCSHNISDDGVGRLGMKGEGENWDDE